MSFKEDSPLQQKMDEKKQEKQKNKQEKQQNKPINKNMTKEERKALYSNQITTKRGGSNAGAASTSTRRPSIKSDQPPTQTAQQQPQQQPQQQQQKSKEKTQEKSKQTKQEKAAPSNKQRSDSEDKQNRLFSHLDKYIHPENRTPAPINDFKLHPAIVELGLQYASGAIRGSNSRTMALLTALKHVTTDYVQPEHELMNRDFGNRLVPMIDYLKSFRPLSAGMGNALRHIKQKIPKLNPDSTAEENKESLIDTIDAYIKERILVAVEQIVKNGVARIKNGDVILTYARSEVIEEIFVKAKEIGTDFRVIIVDSRPKNEGRELLQRLASVGVKCSFIYINAVSHVMKEVSKVMIGAHSMLSNGSVYSRIGTAAVCMMANAYNIPVLVCCETYKFSESTQLDSITRNELGDPYELCSIDREDVPEILHDFETKQNIHVLNLTYDVTDMDYVDMVITEFGSIPPTSVAVILREYHHK